MKINRYPKYEIFEDGRIMRFGKCLKHRINRCGYPIVWLYKNKVRRQEFVHKLLLEAFISKPDPTYNQGNHVNGIKTDNRLENLEWCTNSQNQLHAYRIGLNSRKRLDKIQIATIRSCHTFIPALALSSYFKTSLPNIYGHVQSEQ